MDETPQHFLLDHIPHGQRTYDIRSRSVTSRIAHDFQKCLDTYNQSFDRREQFRMEYRLRHHDGQYRWILNGGVFEAVVKPKLDECFQGKVVRYEMKYTYPELGERDLSVSYFPIEGRRALMEPRVFFRTSPSVSGW